MSRCQEKTETDYMNELFPQSSKLLDTIRCSISFTTLSNLFKTLNYFQKCDNCGYQSFDVRLPGTSSNPISTIPLALSDIVFS